MTTDQLFSVTSSEEYRLYLSALCKLSSQYVSRIRVQFAEKAYEMYENETVRRIVLAYGEELEKLDEYRLRQFDFVSRYGSTTPDHLNDDCLNNASHYAATIKMLFEIH